MVITGISEPGQNQDPSQPTAVHLALPTEDPGTPLPPLQLWGEQKRLAALMQPGEGLALYCPLACAGPTPCFALGQASLLVVAPAPQQPQGQEAGAGACPGEGNDSGMDVDTAAPEKDQQPLQCAVHAGARSSAGKALAPTAPALGCSASGPVVWGRVVRVLQCRRLLQSRSWGMAVELQVQGNTGGAAATGPTSQAAAREGPCNILVLLELAPGSRLAPSVQGGHCLLLLGAVPASELQQASTGPSQPTQGLYHQQHQPQHYRQLASFLQQVQQQGGCPPPSWVWSEQAPGAVLQDLSTLPALLTTPSLYGPSMRPLSQLVNMQQQGVGQGEEQQQPEPCVCCVTLSDVQLSRERVHRYARTSPATLHTSAACSTLCHILPPRALFCNWFSDSCITCASIRPCVHA